MGWPSVEAGLAAMSSAEFAEWVAYDSLEPIGQRREDVRLAFLASLIANQWRGKDSEPVTPDEVLAALPWWNEKHERKAVLDEDGAGEASPPAAHWTAQWVEGAWAELQAALTEAAPEGAAQGKEP